MNAASYPPFSGPPPPSRRPTAPEVMASQVPPRQRGLIRWIQENSFAPEWLPERLSNPLVGYLAAGLIEGAAVGLVLLILSLFPSFAFHGILVLIGVVLVAMGWGAGPGLFATLLGTGVLYFVVLPPHVTWMLTDPADGVGLILNLAVGVCISLLSGQKERARRQAEETARLLIRAESRSRAEAERLSTVLEVLPSAVMLTSNQGQLLAMNPATRTLWGGEVPLGTDIMQFPKDKLWRAQSGRPLSPEEWPLVRTLGAGDLVLNDELEIEVLDGQRKIILSSAAPIRDETGTITGAVVSAQDISNLRWLEREVTERAQELEAVFEAMTDGVFVYNAHGHIVRVNAAGRQLVGPDALPHDRSLRERASRRTPLDEEGQPVPFERIPSMRILRGEVLTGAQAMDIYFPTPEGGLLAFNTGGTPLRSGEGVITGAVVVTRDVTERHRLEREVAERVQELEAIFEAMTDGITVLDAEGMLIHTNRAFRTLHGVEQDAVFLTLPLEQRLAALALADEQGQPLAAEARPITRLLRGETLAGVDVKITSLDGRALVLNVGGAPIRDQRGRITGCVGVFRDMTTRHHLEARTRETLGALVAMAEAIVAIRPTTPDEMVGRTAPATSTVAAGTTLSLVAHHLAQLTQSALGCRHVSIVALDAATRHLHPVTTVGLPPDQQRAWWASWSPAPCLEDRFGPSVAAALRAGVSAPLDQAYLPERSRSILVGAHNGRIVPMLLGEVLVGILVVAYAEPDQADDSRAQEWVLTGTLAQLGALVLERDQLLRGWAETRASELALAETKAQMDTFLGIASHELKTPLTSLKLSLQLSQRRLRQLIRGRTGAAAASMDPRLEGAVEQLGRTSRQMERMERLVNDLVDVSRIQAGQLELRPDQTDLVTLVQEAVREQQQAAPERQIPLQRPAVGEVLVEVDAGRIEQVVTNFLTNALKYSPADRSVEVGVEVEVLRGAGGTEGGQEEQEQARVWVRDQGPGLPVSEQEQIWERFHRVGGVEVQSGTGVGLGLGLYISRMIVERHHGQVGVDSAPGQGSTFWFTLPLDHTR